MPPIFKSMYWKVSTGTLPPVSAPSGSMPDHSKVKFGPMVGLNAVGPFSIFDVGGTVFAENARVAGVRSIWPSLSSSPTLKTWTCSSWTGRTWRRRPGGYQVEIDHLGAVGYELRAVDGPDLARVGIAGRQIREGRIRYEKLRRESGTLVGVDGHGLGAVELDSGPHGRAVLEIVRDPVEE